MTIGTDEEQRRALRGNEDRRIDILIEIADINQEYDERVSALREEYEALGREYYRLRLERIADGRSSMPLPMDGQP